MPSTLEQALTRLDPGAQPRGDTLADYWRTLKGYAAPPLQKLLTDPNINASHPLNAVGPGMDLISSPFAAAGDTWVGRDPHATESDRRIGGQVGGMIVPLPGEGTAAAERALESEAAGLGRARRAFKHAPRSADPTAFINHPDYAPHVEQVPIAWLDELAHPEFDADFEHRVQRLQAQTHGGVSAPAHIMAGTWSRNAKLGAGYQEIEAAKRAGYTHYPAVVHLSDTGGIDRQGTTHLEEDIIPHDVYKLGEKGQPESMTARPSHVFKSLQPGEHSSGHAIASRKEATSRTPVWHGTKTQWETPQNPNTVARAKARVSFDTLTTHSAKEPRVAEQFADTGRHQGESVKRMTVPGPEQTYPIQQVTYPQRRTHLTPEERTQYPEGIRTDTYDMNRFLSQWGLMGNRPGVLSYLKHAMGIPGTDEQLGQVADQALQGWRFSAAPGEQPKTLWEHLATRQPTYRNAMPAEDQVGIVEHAKRMLADWGYKGGKYLNTAEDVRGYDPTSYMTMDPADIEYAYKSSPEWQRSPVHNLFDPMGQKKYEALHAPKPQPGPPITLEDLLSGATFIPQD